MINNILERMRCFKPRPKSVRSSQKMVRKTNLASIIVLLTLLPYSISFSSNPTPSFTFPLEKVEQGIFLPVIINGLLYNFLVDTGATFTLVDSSFKPLLGKPIKNGLVETATGHAEVLFYKPVNIFVGGHNLSTEHNFLISDLEILRKVSGIEFQGILGMAILHKHVLEIDFDEEFLSINPQTLEDNDRRAFVRLKTTPSHQGIPTIPIEMGNEKIDFILDTGDNGFGRLQTEIIDHLINEKLVQSVAVDTTVSLSSLAKTRRIRVKEIEIGGNTYRNVVMRESLQNALGLGFLKQHHIIMDFPNREVFLKKGLGVFQVDREDKSGLKLLSHNDQIIVAQVDERGPAAKAGILQGDVILNVNGSPISGDDLYILRTYLKGNDRDLINLDLARSSETLAIQFELQEGFDFIDF